VVGLPTIIPVHSQSPHHPPTVPRTAPQGHQQPDHLTVSLAVIGQAQQAGKRPRCRGEGSRPSLGTAVPRGAPATGPIHGRQVPRSTSPIRLSERQTVMVAVGGRFVARVWGRSASHGEASLILGRLPLQSPSVAVRGVRQRRTASDENGAFGRSAKHRKRPVFPGSGCDCPRR
jgi:hypothetical protein